MLQIKILNILTVTRMARMARMARPLARIARWLADLYISLKLQRQKTKLQEVRIHRKQKDDGCTFYHNTLQTKLSVLGIWKDKVQWQSFLH